MSFQSVILNTTAVAGSTATWFPAAVSVTGTLSSTSTRITGTGTAFKTEFRQGDYIVNAGNNEIQRVGNIFSDTDMETVVAFAAPLSGSTVKSVANNKIRYLKVVFKTNDGEIRSAEQTANATWPYVQPWESQRFDAFITPQLITPGGGGAVVITGE